MTPDEFDEPRVMLIYPRSIVVRRSVLALALIMFFAVGFMTATAVWK